MTAISDRSRGRKRADLFDRVYDSDRASGFEPLRLVPKDNSYLPRLGLDLKLRHENRRRTQTQHRPSE